MIEASFVRVEENQRTTKVKGATRLQDPCTALFSAAVTGKIDVRTVTTQGVS